MDPQEFRDFLVDLIDEIDKQEVKEEKKVLGSDRKLFISFIMEYGRSMYDGNISDLAVDSDSLFENISDILCEELDLDYVAIRTQDHCIALATPRYIKDAKVEFAKALRIIPDVFTEVSGPMSTVLIIDCEKQFLRKAYLGLGEDEWLL